MWLSTKHATVPRRHGLRAGVIAGEKGGSLASTAFIGLGQGPSFICDSAEGFLGDRRKPPRYVTAYANKYLPSAPWCEDNARVSRCGLHHRDRRLAASWSQVEC